MHTGRAKDAEVVPSTTGARLCAASRRPESRGTASWFLPSEPKKHSVPARRCALQISEPLDQQAEVEDEAEVADEDAEGGAAEADDQQAEVEAEAEVAEVAEVADEDAADAEDAEEAISSPSLGKEGCDPPRLRPLALLGFRRRGAHHELGRRACRLRAVPLAILPVALVHGAVSERALALAVPQALLEVALVHGAIRIHTPAPAVRKFIILKSARRTRSLVVNALALAVLLALPPVSSECVLRTRSVRRSAHCNCTTNLLGEEAADTVGLGVADDGGPPRAYHAP